VLCCSAEEELEGRRAEEELEKSDGWAGAEQGRSGAETTQNSMAWIGRE
jgi:hypothetical protein